MAKVSGFQGRLSSDSPATAAFFRDPAILGVNSSRLGDEKYGASGGSQILIFLILGGMRRRPCVMSG
jgi:hypothetical protein